MAALPGGTDVAINHSFVSGKADGADPTLVQPSKWNAPELDSGGADGQKAVRDAGQTHGSSWVNYDPASFTNSTGAGAAVGDVVAVSAAADNAVVLDDTVSSFKKFVVALQTPANTAVGAYAYAGPVPGVKAQGAIAAGQFIRKSATTKAVEDAGVAVGSSTAPPAGTIGFATSAAAAGFVNVFLFLETVAISSSQGLTDELTGLELSNDGSAPTTDVDIAVGAAASNDAVIANRVLISLTSAFVKRLSTAWVVGSGNGMLATGVAVADGTYHIFLIRRTDTGVVDIAADTSATGANIAANTNANYTQKRRIGSIIRLAGSILAFTQDGDEFLLSTPILDVNAANPGTAAVTRVLTVPVGVKVKALMNVHITPTTSGNDLFFAYLSSLDAADVAPSSTVAPLATYKASGGGNGFNGGSSIGAIRTDTSASIRSRCGSASGASDVLRIATLGWIDRRGRG